jgi:hypothetical protein
VVADTEVRLCGLSVKDYLQLPRQAKKTIGKLLESLPEVEYLVN